MYIFHSIYSSLIIINNLFITSSDRYNVKQILYISIIKPVSLLPFTPFAEYMYMHIIGRHYNSMVYVTFPQVDYIECV